jgi:hypothetical protein
MTGQTCSVCGTTLSGGGRGRPSVYCSRACQAKAYRDRKNAQSDDGRGEAARTARAAAAELASAALGLVELVEATEVQPEMAAASKATAQRALDTLMGLALAARDETPDSRDESLVRSAPVPSGDVDQAAGVAHMREDLIEAVPARYVPTAEKPAEKLGPREDIPETVTQSTAPPAKRSRRAVGGPGEDTSEEYEVVRSPSYDTTGTWDVIADGNRVGQVRPLHRLGSGKAWTAHGPAGIAITVGAGKGGGYRTRNAAAVQVLITHRIMERNRKEKRARDRRIAKFDTEQGGANR